MTKKTIKKVLAKKAIPQKSASASKKQGARKKGAVRASAEQSFWVHFGPILYDIHDLLKGLQIISDDQFAHHVNKEKNDFALWVEGVLHGKTLAKKLQKCTTRNDAYKAVAQYIKAHY